LVGGKEVEDCGDEETGCLFFGGETQELSVEEDDVVFTCRC